MSIYKALLNMLFLSSALLCSGALLAQQNDTMPASVATTRTLTLEDARQKYASPQSRFTDIEGINVHYTDEGKGPALLLIHGTLGDLSDWHEWSEQLKTEYRVVRLDLPGFGLTAPIANKNYSIERMHTLIDGLMDSLGIEQFGIVGISYGGVVTFRYAATRTDRVTSMILLNSAGIQSGKAVKPKEGEKPKPKKNMFIDPVVTTADIEDFYSGYINDPTRRTPAFIQRKLDYMNIVGRLEEATYAYKLYERNDPFRVLAHVKVPSLIIWGAGNKALDTETANLFIDALKNACSTELVTFEKGGHYINVELPDATAKAAKGFLKKLNSQSNTTCQKPQ